SEATRRAGARRPRAASRHVPGRLRAARSPGVVHRRGRRALGYRSRGGASACAPRAPHAARLPISPRRGDAMTANLVCRDAVELLMAYLGVVLSETEREAMEPPLPRCPRCVAFVESSRQPPRILRAATAAELPEHLAASLRRFLAERQERPPALVRGSACCCQNCDPRVAWSTSGRSSSESVPIAPPTRK